MVTEVRPYCLLACHICIMGRVSKDRLFVFLFCHICIMVMGMVTEDRLRIGTYVPYSTIQHGY